jgi:deoxyadenosine/deoxycytidine kinase
MWLESGHLEKVAEEPYVAQTFFFHTRITTMRNLLQQSAARIIISERSPFSDRYIFWDIMCENGLPTELAAKTYPLLWETWTTLLGGLMPGLFLYLRLDVDTSQQRMRQRNRECEQDTVTDVYQQQLAEAHERIYGGTHTPVGGGIPCIQMSSRDDFKNSSDVASALAERLIKEIEQLI